ncbi:hypothetical protein CC86DRAFT_403628 [Ophiobolus disseminans]|uniref:RNA polymerase I-specific transcription initiation factor RRN6-like protein n=1 Tax=Ophiobolus disseminans TaxID=1469910 RepID=A0A6A7A841_9PLEO|nr:hypothetical protein CC86DRAFT_403628 [Ophiobolus disseminans]
MAETSLSHLNHGHAGAPTFDLETREWSFGRQFATTKFKQIGIREDGNLTTTEVVPSPVQLPSAAISTRLTDAKANAKRLLQDYPELSPATDLLPHLAVTSTAILSTTATYDPLIGNLFSTGYITYTYEGTHETRSHIWENPRRVAATVTGEAGSILRLSFLYKEVHGWSDDKKVRIRGDTLRETETGFWNEEAAPIQQVCFAQSQDRSQLLAVRLLTKTVIFRPIYAQRFRPAVHSPYYDLPFSLIDLHPIITLSIDQSGDTPHADVTFNPDFQFQFAVVDQSQGWSVWDIDNKRKSDGYNISCMVQGTIADDADLSGEDGWARILWVGDVNTIIVCNRRLFSVISIKGSTFKRLPCPALFSEKSSDWFLDVQRHPSQRGRVFVLTSTTLSLLAVTTSNESVDTTVVGVGARVLLSWRHYRDPEDFTLRISVQMIDEDNVSVLLLTRLDTLMQVYTFSDSSSDPTAPVSSANATRLELAFDGKAHPIQTILEPLHFQGDVASMSESLGRSYFAQGLRFYKAFVLCSDLSIHEAVVYCTTRSHGVDDIAWSRAYQPNKSVRTIGNIQEMDDFLESDAIEVMENPMPKLASQTPQWVQRGPPEAHRVADHTSLYDALIQNGATTVDIPLVASQVKQLLVATQDMSQLPLGTLNEFAGIPITVSDVDEASSLFHDLTTLEDQNDLVRIRRIASAHVLKLGDEELSMSGIYDNVLQNWIGSLPSGVPLRARQRKERLARRVAAEIMLASTRIQQRTIQAPVTAEPGPSQYSGIGLPILSSQPLPSSSAGPTPWMSSQPILTPSSSQSQSQSTLPTLPLPVDPLARLKKHLMFEDDEQSPPQTTMPPSVTQLLSHWQPGTDPRTYDWEAVERADRTDNLDEKSQQQLEKARKRKERRERKQQRENELAQSKPSSQPFAFPQPALPRSTFGQPSSQPPIFTQPTTYPRSSPGPMLGGFGGSSQLPYQPFTHVPFPGTGIPSQGVPSGLAAQSQVEPGRFGGRPDKKKKKKNRISGF